jgi:hypothetical protein
VGVLEVDDGQERIVVQLEEDTVARPQDLVEAVRDLGVAEADLLCNED